MPKTAKTKNEQNVTVDVRHPNVCLSEEEIIRYLFYSLTKEDRYRIESHITNCDLCYDAVAGARRFRSEAELRAFTGSMRKEIRQKYSKSGAVIRKNRLFYYSAAALVLISFSSIGYWMLRDPNGRVADEYIRPYSNMIPLSRGESRLTLLEEAMLAYESEHYAGAQEKLDRFLKDQPEHEAANLYFGISAMLSGDADAAIPHLQKVSGSKETRISEAAQWYLALAYVKQERKREAKELLKLIDLGGGYFGPSAKELMKRIGVE